MVEKGNFSVIRAKRDGMDAIIVVDLGLNARDLHVRFPWLLTITLPIRRPNGAGLCDEAESEVLSDIEDQLLSGVDTHDSCYMGRTTWNRMRQIFVYVRDPDNVVDEIKEQLSQISEQKIEVTVDKHYEPEWETYLGFKGRPS
jgi:hypothetical protein